MVAIEPVEAVAAVAVFPAEVAVLLEEVAVIPALLQKELEDIAEEIEAAVVAAVVIVVDEVATDRRSFCQYCRGSDTFGF